MNSITKMCCLRHELPSQLLTELSLGQAERYIHQSTGIHSKIAPPSMMCSSARKGLVLGDGYFLFRTLSFGLLLF